MRDAATGVFLEDAIHWCRGSNLGFNRETIRGATGPKSFRYPPRTTMTRRPQTLLDHTAVDAAEEAHPTAVWQ
ncbi:hypothetical protein K0M31_012840 [Melipona bicolor]|uniref:Uncharacterized protein n=1 Tax=Melipona bicolor TaxID=60889 RepID=A0AA40FJA7_9HYME|nr:hypothetical protein K0M31_012840 [Melipona bicolor]